MYTHTHPSVCFNTPFDELHACYTSRGWCWEPGSHWPISGQKEQAMFGVGVGGGLCKMLTWHKCDTLFVLVKIFENKGP